MGLRLHTGEASGENEVASRARHRQTLTALGGEAICLTPDMRCPRLAGADGCVDCWEVALSWTISRQGSFVEKPFFMSIGCLQSLRA